MRKLYPRTLRSLRRCDYEQPQVTASLATPLWPLESSKAANPVPQDRVAGPKYRDGTTNCQGRGISGVGEH